MSIDFKSSDFDSGIACRSASLAVPTKEETMREIIENAINEKVLYRCPYC